MILRVAIAVLVGGFPGAVFERTAAAELTAAIEFQRDIQPLLKAHCMKCHGLEDREAELDLRTVELMWRGGKSGPAIQAGAAERSLLYTKISDRSMPPKGELPLTEEKIDLIRRWIDGGLLTNESVESDEIEVDDDDRDHWAFRKASRPRVPVVQHPQLARTSLDRFCLPSLRRSQLPSRRKRITGRSSGAPFWT